jgi:hypothetical protein
MNKQALTTIETEAFALSDSTAPGERRQPVLDDCGKHPPKPEARRRAALRWLIDTLALAGAGIAGVNVGVWLDTPNVDQTGRKDETLPPQRSVATARHDTDPWPFV